jgi:hypothetical protein
LVTIGVRGRGGGSGAEVGTMLGIDARMIGPDGDNGLLDGEPLGGDFGTALPLITTAPGSGLIAILPRDGLAIDGNGGGAMVPGFKRERDEATGSVTPPIFLR